MRLPSRLAIGGGLAAALLLTSVSASAITATPTLSSPANFATNWLYNGGSNFSWLTITGATYRIVVSDRADFGNYSETSSSCLNSGCVAATVTTPYATRSSLPNYWFYGTATYYWKVRAYTPSGGWSAWSAPRNFTTTSTQLRSVVNNAMTYAGRASPQSYTSPGAWYTDMDAPAGSSTADFTRYSNAMTTLRNHVNSYAGGLTGWINAGRPITTAVRDSMRASLSSYPTIAVKDATIDQMRTVYAGSVPAAGDWNGMLSLMRIRAQCKEFADRMVIAGGLRRNNYNSTHMPYPRPGMYVFKTPDIHAGIVRAVSYSSGGAATVMVIEANWLPDVWDNPNGQTPWWRVVDATRTQAVGGTSGWIVFEPSL